ncbi:hypothetical protein ABPG74_016681 [Tetrahymena malaccensis]
MKQIPQNLISTISFTIVIGSISFPTFFINNGIFQSLILLVISAVITDNASQIYISKLSQDFKTIEDIVKHFLGSKWKMGYQIVKIIYLLQLSLIYILYINEFLRSIINQFLDQQHQLDMKVIALIISPFIFTLYLIKKVEIYMKASYVNLLILLLIFILYIYLSASSIHQSQIIDLMSQFDLSQIPSLLSQNNLSFQFQIYLPDLLVFSNATIKNKQISRITIIISFFYFFFCGLFGSLALSSQGIKKGISGLFINIYDNKPITLIMKLSMIFHVLTNMGYKFIVLRKTLHQLILKKKNLDSQKKKKFELCLQLFLSLLLILLSISTTSQQNSFIIITGSITAFFILYLVPYNLKYCSYQKKLKYVEQKKSSQKQLEIILQNHQQQVLMKENSNCQKFLVCLSINNTISNIKNIEYQNNSEAQIGYYLKKRQLIKRNVSTIEKYKDETMIYIGYTMLFYGLYFIVIKNAF